MIPERTRAGRAHQSRWHLQPVPAACPCGLPGQSGLSGIATWPVTWPGRYHPRLEM